MATARWSVGSVKDAPRRAGYDDNPWEPCHQGRPRIAHPLWPTSVLTTAIALSTVSGMVCSLSLTPVATFDRWRERS